MQGMNTMVRSPAVGLLMATGVVICLVGIDRVDGLRLTNSEESLEEDIDVTIFESKTDLSKPMKSIKKTSDRVTQKMSLGAYRRYVSDFAQQATESEAGIDKEEVDILEAIKSEFRDLPVNDESLSNSGIMSSFVWLDKIMEFNWYIDPNLCPDKTTIFGVRRDTMYCEPNAYGFNKHTWTLADGMSAYCSINYGTVAGTIPIVDENTCTTNGDMTTCNQTKEEDWKKGQCTPTWNSTSGTGCRGFRERRRNRNDVQNFISRFHPKGKEGSRAASSVASPSSPPVKKRVEATGDAVSMCDAFDSKD